MSLKNEIGSFCWFSLMTKDVVASNNFYKSLFNWEMSEMEIPNMPKSTLYGVDHLNFANPVPLGDSSAPAHWISYITTQDVDESCKKVKRLGGKVCHDPFELPTIGRTAIIKDPSGAAFHLFTPENKNQDLNVIGDNIGQICWMELMADDPGPLITFYSEMFNWSISEPMEMHGGLYFSLDICGKKQGGIMKRPPHIPKTPPAWMPYIFVEDLEKSNALAKEHGGDILLEKMKIPDTGIFSLIKDPTGATFYQFQYTKD